MTRIPEHWSFEQTVIHLLQEILVNQAIDFQNQERQMATLQDVLDKVAKVSADVDTALAKAKQNTESADLDQVNAALDAVDAKLTA